MERIRRIDQKKGKYGWAYSQGSKSALFGSHGYVEKFESRG